MKAWKKCLASVVAAGALGLSGALVVAGPSAAAPSDDAGCTGKTVSSSSKEYTPFGGTVVGSTASTLGQAPGMNFGQVVIVEEATYPHDRCDELAQQ